jgi:hypothetical protein
MLFYPPERMRKVGRKGEQSERARKRQRQKERASERAKRDREISAYC